MVFDANFPSGKPVFERGKHAFMVFDVNFSSGKPVFERENTAFTVFKKKLVGFH